MLIGALQKHCTRHGILRGEKMKNLKRIILYGLTHILIFGNVCVLSGCGDIMGGLVEKPKTKEKSFITPTTFKGTAASWTSDPNYAAVAVHENSEEIVAITQTDALGNVLTVTGAVWTSPDGDSIVVYNGSNGLPERAIAGNNVILFENYTANSVDIAFVYPDGTTEIVRNVLVDSSLLIQLQSQNAAFALSGGLLLAETLRLAALSIKVVGCASSLAAVAATGGIALPLAALSCGSLLVSTITYILPGEFPLLEATSTSLGIVRCNMGDVTSCITLVLNGLADEITNAESTQTFQSASISQAQNSLLYGGTGNVKITLTWSNTADIDLWVTEPSGESIGYNHMVSSVSGGMLDFDDRDGYGPENIYWPINGAPAGVYTVKINYFAGTGTADYQVIVEVDGATNTYTGTGSLTTIGQWITVTSFAQ